MKNHPLLIYPALALMAALFLCATYETPDQREARLLRNAIARTQSELAATQCALNGTDAAVGAARQNCEARIDQLQAEEGQ